ncbi:MAG: UDP-N-acetylglucosamine diphosphorylase / glucose-phosphate thymidylyltransferase [Nocardioidaceae bacterium]|nr:UDP-N-acetylglucosamine diphosphorylase / glucose-phosphate thymidylyltransferase [Nocardioidaceae bacterium]
MLTTADFFRGDGNLPFDLVGAFPALDDLVGEARRLMLDDFLRGGTEVNGDVLGHVDLTGPVYVGAGSVIHPMVSIAGPAYIGRNCSIRHGAQIRSGSIISDECVIGHDAEVKNTVCLTGAKLQSGIFAGDSVLGLGARVGSGTILSNRRFGQDSISLGSGDHKMTTDLEFLGAVIGDYARLGANVVTAPGTVVGPYTWVASLVSLFGYVPRGKLVLLKQELEYRDKAETDLRSGRGEYERA